LILLDIDHFKQVNDQHGHEAGDRALLAISQHLSQACREGDILARWGGEEFMFLLPETDLAQASAFAERVRLSIEAQRLSVKQESIVLTASFGVAEHTRQTQLEELINEADVELYKAKQSGRNRVSPARTG
jgi:diguanylate cyclase (GGDEF)-like protein